VDASVEPAAAKKAVTAGAIGNFIEWYDFAVYGYFAAVIAGQFFPSENRVASLLATFAVFAVAFFMRPWGRLYSVTTGTRWDDGRPSRWR
jgi:MHS family proline/betaine transporter-like MFS transporter